MSTALEFQRVVMGKEFGLVVGYSCNRHCSHCGACCSDIIPLLPIRKAVFGLEVSF